MQPSLQVLLIHLAPTVIFFDSDSMHMLTSRTFVDRIGVPLDDLGYDLVVLKFSPLLECV